MEVFERKVLFFFTKMSTLSAKARAFSVDYLLNKDDCSGCRETDSSSPPQEDTVCATMGDGPGCCHDSVYTFTGAFFYYFFFGVQLFYNNDQKNYRQKSINVIQH